MDDASIAHDYRSLPAFPERYDAGGVLARLCDAIGFRYHWATDRLRAEDWDFRPTDASMSIGELDRHIHALLRRVAAAFALPVGEVESTEPAARRAAFLALLARLRQRLLDMPAEDLPAVGDFWLLINGPLADALSHIGQVAAFRRMAGNPAPRVNHFTGTVAPRER